MILKVITLTRKVEEPVNLLDWLYSNQSSKLTGITLDILLVFFIESFELLINYPLVQISTSRGY